MSNDTNVDDPPEDASGAAPDEEQAQESEREPERTEERSESHAPASNSQSTEQERQGDRSPTDETGDPDDVDGGTDVTSDEGEQDSTITVGNDGLGTSESDERDDAGSTGSGGAVDSTDRGDDDIETVEDLGSTVEVDPGVEVDEEIAEDDLLGGLQIDSTEDIEVPDRLVDQVIGQDEARDIIIKAAKQRRHVMMIGSPGTGKSMLAKAMSQLLPQEDLQDVLVYHNPDDGNEPKVRTVPAGKGEQIIDAHKEEARKRNQMRSILMWIIIAIIIGYTILSPASILMGIIAAGVIWLIFRYTSRGTDAMVPNMIVNNGEQRQAPFEDATGAHAGALLGDVRHDPFQSGGMETPSHDRVEPGSIHKSNKGVLFVDEINTLDVRTQQKLMTAIQEGEFSITGQSERSSGAMVQTEPVPCDFVMIAAGNLDAMENMHPALRNRVKGYGYEVYMDDTIESTPEMRRKYARFIAQEVERDGRLPHFTRDAVEELLLEAKRRSGRKNHLTLHFRSLGGLVRVAGDIARAEDRDRTTRDDVLQAKQRSRSIEQQLADDYIERRKDYELQVTDDGVEGRVNGLAVMGEDSGIMLPVMAEIAPAQGGGQVIATGKLKEMAEESVQNVSAIIKKFSDVDLSEKDIHIQFVQAGQQGVDGDSASITVATAVISALEDIPVNQSVAMTGSLSVRGDVLPVGGVTHKIEAAAKAGCSKVIIPKANEQDVMIEDEYDEMVEIIPCENISEVLDVALEGEPKKDSLVDRLKSITGSAFDQQTVGSASGSNPSPQ
ncbi:ATP-dependent protease Lon [Natrialba magadii ATCC 43099]|uniref:Archaeal Lon protease n=1 Tax=Natrialba magadii (strain ATCC 43099 / DSM 3394 / CCM 3739 / CIP 104546 / IAM 13178 / JCM 8861 / NBRC 102185 / NCIMB 2190 / MS3) TaxID=547559 RepID=C5MK48_NATMM|nr:ATP-dependent protease LonB [Natrialba magadii]ACR43883.1 ATP-dependent Lon protease [Natrialba magadii ATCC 43099]ADD06376.1 ATP-dependent protease Lon [Natrialba magadii ATCC 43099]ELY31481.1 ATP-dependent protease Lon [Natrialba magadii ATCC 43099]